MHDDELEEIITRGTDNDSLLWKDDLRKHSNREAKQTIFRHFGLDPSSTYAVSPCGFATRNSNNYI